jgi:two-component sensor histidine kinase
MQEGQKPGPDLVGQLALVLALVAASTVLRWLIGTAPGVTPYATFFPAVLVAAFAGGWIAAIVSIPLCLAATNLLFIAPSAHAEATILVNNAVFAATSVVIASLGLYGRILSARLRARASRLEGLLDEQNHRIKNNLSMVSSLLTMQAKAATDQGVRDELATAVARVRNVADIHTQLYRGNSREVVDLRDYLSQLCAAFEAVLDPDRITLDYSIASVRAPMEQALPIGMIVVELLTNANKHAYPAPTMGVISVRLEKARRRLKLIVSDKGKGLPLASTPDAGLGVRVVRSLVNQLNAQMTIANKPGATFEIKIPYRAPKQAR